MVLHSTLDKLGGRFQVCTGARKSWHSHWFPYNGNRVTMDIQKLTNKLNFTSNGAPKDFNLGLPDQTSFGIKIVARKKEGSIRLELMGIW